MLMTFKPPTDLTEAGRALLKVIQDAAPDWITRQQIGDALGRRRITPYDLAQLEYLLKAGLIEAREAQRGAFSKRWEYKAK